MPKIEEQSYFINCVFKSLFNQITLFLTKFTQLTILWLEFSDFDQLEIGKMKYKYLVINLSLYVLPNKAHPLYVFFKNNLQKTLFHYMDLHVTSENTGCFYFLQ